MYVNNMDYKEIGAKLDKNVKRSAFLAPPQYI
jgi:hypothetical protein